MRKRRKIVILRAVMALLLWVSLPAAGQAAKNTSPQEKRQEQEKQEKDEKKKTQIEKKGKKGDKEQAEKKQQKETKDPLKILESRSIAGAAKKYTGKPGDFYFKDADLKNVLIQFARDYQFNIVIDPDVSGRVTCSLTQVPWDLALDLILRQNGMAMMRYGSVINIVKLDASPKKKK